MITLEYHVHQEMAATTQAIVCRQDGHEYRGGTPQKGDILVFSGNSNNPYGHVAIYESEYSTYHQNFDGKRWKNILSQNKGI